MPTPSSSAPPCCAADERRQLRDVVAADEAVTSALSAAQIEASFDERLLLRHVATLIERLEQLEEQTHAAR